MKYLLILFTFLISINFYGQVDLGQFKMSNTTSPAFMLVEESPTSIYTPDNIRALAIHALDNLGQSISVEVSPYFFLGIKNKERTYYKYIGVEKNDGGNLKQNPLSGLNTTTVSLAYVDKEFSGIQNSRKTYSIGLRTTLLRFYDKKKVYDNAQEIAQLLQDIVPPAHVLEQGEKAIKEYYINVQNVDKKFEPYQKTIKPLFRVDGAIGYSALFKENSINSGTANRFGSWLTAEGSLLLNEGAENAHNNYINILLTARYVEDGFNVNANQNYTNQFYRDFGGKLELEFGKFEFGYEYISRNGSTVSERSVGTIKFSVNKDVSLIGGFGKDFPADENLITVFGVNWGLNLGERTTTSN